MTELIKRDVSRPEFIALIAGFMALNALAIDIMLPALPHMAESLNVMNENDRHWVVLAYTFGLGVAQLVFGPLSDRFGRRAPMFAGLVVYVICCFAAIFAPNFATLIALRVVQGIGAAGTRAITVSIVRDRYSGRAMAEVMSLVFMVFMVIPIIAPTIGQLILLTGSWQLIFAFMGTLAAIITAWGFIRLPETLAEADRRPLSAKAIAESFVIVCTNRVAFMYGLAGMFLFAALMAFIPASQQVYVDIFGLGNLFPLAFAGMASLMAVGSFLNSRMVARYGMRRISHFAILVYIALALFWVVLSLFGELHFWVFFPTLSIIMFMFGWASSNMNSLSMEPLGAVAGTASSVFGFIQTVGGALIGGFIGSLYNGTTTPLAGGYLFAGAAALVCVLIAEKGKLFGVGTENSETDLSHHAAH